MPSREYDLAKHDGRQRDLDDDSEIYYEYVIGSLSPFKVEWGECAMAHCTLRRACLAVYNLYNSHYTSDSQQY